MKKGFYFKQYEAPNQSPFEKLFGIFKELITHTSGDFDEAIDWLRELDVEYKLTDENYTIDDFIEDLKKNKYYTHIEIDPSLILGVMGNQIIYPENNPLPRNSFSCGQSKQAVSVYHSNFQSRIDKMGVILNSGQIPLLKSKYLEYINNEEMPYGVNAIVAIMSKF